VNRDCFEFRHLFTFLQNQSQHLNV
jgi:hypothetical protein